MSGIVWSIITEGVKDTVICIPILYVTYLFMEMLERFPVVGDELRYENFTLKVLEAEERRVDKLLLTIDEPEEEDEDE